MAPTLGDHPTTSQQEASSSLAAMEQSKPRPQRFYGYPRPVEGPHVPLTKSDDANPVFRGFPLVVGAWLFVTFYQLRLEHQADFEQCFQTWVRPDILVEKRWL